MKLLFLSFLLLTGCDVIVKELTYNPKCVDGYYVMPAGYENQGHWGLQNLFCEELDVTNYSGTVSAKRCMKVFGDPRVRYEARFSNVIYVPTKCFNTMAGVKDVQ